MVYSILECRIASFCSSPFIQEKRRIPEPTYISKIESGERRLDVIEFWRIYKILGKSFEFYFQFDEKPGSGKTKRQR
ncbi:hypothetical protein [Leptospira santarosai]|uniref:hypothetical protein n=1 Tax=Leptospira santarosai TaxID=28183 RepID=UPI0039AFBC98